MPSTTPSFASAAAASTRPAEPPSEWSRRPNGATQTFRRPSQANIPTSSHQREYSTSTAPSSQPAPSTGAYVPPHITAMRNGASADLRYSKQQLLDLYKEQRDSHSLEGGLSGLYVGDSDLHTANGSAAAKWSRRNDENLPNPDVCWEKAGIVEPSGLVDMTEEEREMFSTSVNSPLKGPNPNPTREAGRDGQGLRKLSIGQAVGLGGPGLMSPTSSRPGTRRRDTSEGLHSLNTKLVSEEDPLATSSPSLLRRRTDLKDLGQDSIAEEDDPRAIGSLKRANTSTFNTMPQSPWSSGPQSAGLSSTGAFGNFAIGSGTAERRPGVTRGESRFRNLMSRESTDEVKSPIKDKSSFSNFGRLHDHASRDLSSDTIEEPVGSAALGGDSPPPTVPSTDYPSAQRKRMGETPAFPGLGTQRTMSGFGQSVAFGQPGPGEPDEPNSPTFTNPYQSPEQQDSRLHDVEPEEPDLQNFLPGLGGFGGPFGRDPGPGAGLGGHGGFGQGAFERDFAAGGPVNRGFPGLGNLGGLGGLNSPGHWQNQSATPIRDRAGFFDSAGDQSLRSPRETQSPGLAGLGSGAGFGPLGGGLGSIGRGSSRLGSLFPSQMQEQMRGARDNFSETTDRTDDRDMLAHGIAPGTISRDTNSPFHRLGHEELMSDALKGQHGSEGPPQTYSPGSAHGSLHHQPGPGQPSGPQRMPSAIGSITSNQPPAAQQKTMVMPDRIRWIYRDPQGNTQGPWSGLEMHDWYRAGFFSPELLVKKAEDSDFEPLAQLIRRIGNSREPFLVPQIGIPGPPNNSNVGWPNQTQSAGAAQPPFAGSFPSFGTTLTADQQNALERRKQEEQYLMARQKEHLAQQQMYLKQAFLQNNPGTFPQLQQRSSAQSLNSQPSYGSMTSPVGYQPNQMHHPQGQQPSNAYDMRMGIGGLGPIGPSADSLANIQEEQAPSLFERLNIQGGGHGQFGPIQSRSQQVDSQHDQRVSLAQEDRSRLEAEQAESEALQSMIHNEGPTRLQEFQDLQKATEQQQKPIEAPFGLTEEMVLGSQDDDFAISHPRETLPAKAAKTSGDDSAPLSLTEQVQKAASAKQSPLPAVQESAPAPSTSPLPAPAARRSRGNVADAFAAESPASASPSIETPTTSLAPWARDPAITEGLKQPSLKEIQEAEARRAAKAEEMAAAARRAAMERELATQPVAPAPGLPASSTWGSADPASPITPSAWGSKNGASKTPSGSMNKKTLQQIQKEEEALARKAKAAALAAGATNATIANAVNTAQAISAGKRYADLAGKSTPPAVGGPAAAGGNIGSGAWTTVGQGGKAKLPAAPQPTRTVSTPTVTIATRPKPTVTQSRPAQSLTPMDEFRRWAVTELRPTLKGGVNSEDFVDNLANLPFETDFITEAVYQVADNFDCRHFAEEYIRRRILAEKGKVVPSSGSNPSSHHSESKSGGGWSEVARKGPQTTQRDDSNPFKIVAAKKKPGKK